MKTLNDAVVIDNALDLIKKNGKVTTLEIKKALRAEGYWATQVQISVVMDTLYSSNNLEFSNNNGHREYFEASQSNFGGMNPINVKLSSFGPAKHSKPKQPRIPAIEVATPEIGDWEVTSTDLPGTIMYYDMASSRGTVRSAFCKTLHATPPPKFIDYLNTRARRVK